MQTYALTAAEWAKMFGPAHHFLDGSTWQLHWYENVVTGLRYEGEVVEKIDSEPRK